MTSELSLFLGNHTDKFTNWLHQVLDRLESIAGGSTEKDKEMSLTKSIISNSPLVPQTGTVEVLTTTSNPATYLGSSVASTKELLLNSNNQDLYIPQPLSLSSVAGGVANATNSPDGFEEDCIDIRGDGDQMYNSKEQHMEHKTKIGQVILIICSIFL